MSVTRTGRFASLRTADTPAKPPPTTTTCGNAASSLAEYSDLGVIAMTKYTTRHLGADLATGVVTTGGIDEARGDHEHREQPVPYRKTHHDRDRQ